MSANWPGDTLDEMDLGGDGSSILPRSRAHSRTQVRSVSGPASTPQLNSVRSNPILLPSRPPGTVKDIANLFEQPALAVNTSRERILRTTAAAAAAAAASRTVASVAPPKSPVSASSGEGRDRDRTRLQKRRPEHVHRSPKKSPATSFDATASGSFSSQTSTRTMPMTKSQPHAAFNPRRPKSPSKARPLFGEITADGRWNGNFDVPGVYGPLPTFEKAPRRGSESSIALGHGRSQSHQDISMQFLPRPPLYQLNHKRSRSDMDDLRPPQAAPSMPDLGGHAVPALYPTPPDSGRRMPLSRIPVSNRQQNIDGATSSDGGSYPRPASAMSNRPRRLSKSPTRPQTSSRKEHAPAGTRSRYHPPTIANSASTSSTLSAEIVAPVPHKSPPLRSSRPRQPVSAATTSASRARAAERYAPQARDARRPSEQWLGKPYDPQQERNRRRIPELGNIDFEERRARIQKAITASLKSSESRESMRSQSRSASGSQTRSTSRAPSRLASQEHDAVAGADPEHMEDTLRLQTNGLLKASGSEAEPLTSQTDRTVFEDDSPVLGRPVTAPDTTQHTPEQNSILLTSATYQPTKLSTANVIGDASDNDALQSPSVLDNVLRMRERRNSSANRSMGTEFADESPSDLGNGLAGDHGSIRIMLDNDGFEPNSHTVHYAQQNPDRAPVFHQDTFSTNHDYVESPTHTPSDFTDSDSVAAAGNIPRRDDTLKPTAFQAESSPSADAIPDAQSTISRVLDYYQSTGTLTAEMLEVMQSHMVDLNRLSANSGSNGAMIENLLNSVLDSQPQKQQGPGEQMLQTGSYNMPAVTPDTPPLDGRFVPGTVIVYGNDDEGAAHPEPMEEEDFEAIIRKADEEWERQQRGEALDSCAPAGDDDDKPPPPPKDFGYTPRSSIEPASATQPPNLNELGLRISTGGDLDLKGIHAAADRAEITLPEHHMQSPPSTSAIVLPSQPPPLMPPEISTRGPFGQHDMSADKAYSERTSSELSPRYRKGPSGSSRPSIDSQRVPPGLPGSQSMTSFSESTRQTSMDTGADGSVKLQKTVSPGPEAKRLMKRRHIIKELLDTENSYHQDLKIVEDIYKATCTPELVAPEDKKVLFGNCDEIEKFALRFYDEMRKAASNVYAPAKQHRWTNKRGSFSTTQSDGTTSTFADAVSDETDRTTTIGKTFLRHLGEMERIYGSYLRNHDAANQRLSAIQPNTSVKCWLDECHANASDITSAWDLDSLLVKPTQRVAKYPMLLQQLLETTPADHPDHQDLKTAAKDSISMLTRINEAKKRADLVDQMINPGAKRKDSDIRAGFAKAFGRRTEKLKERVGIAEAFQDAEFDELAHKFGGHFIRLQICMRDIQDYVHRCDQAIAVVNNYANALELFTDVSPSQLPEIESKWRKYGQIIRDLTLVAFGEHKADVQKRVLAPMIQCIKLHEGPQNAINKRKKKIVDYAKCKSEERRGQKPDRKTVEAADMYVALNEQLKLDLPKLYTLTAQLVQNCLHCFINVQCKWQSTWERKLRALLEASDIPLNAQQIVPAFYPDFAEVEKRCNVLSICNGSLKLEAATFLSPQTTLVDPTSEASSSKHRRPSTLDGSNRPLSEGSESSSQPATRRHSGIYTPKSEVQPPPPPPTSEPRFRSNSAMSSRVPPTQAPGGTTMGRPWSNSHAIAPNPAFSGRPSTAETTSMQQSGFYPRQSGEKVRGTRPASDATYFTARPTPGSAEVDQHRFSGLFASALPPDFGMSEPRPASPSRRAPHDMPVLFVCASLFEFSIDKTRKEGGYPYLQYVQGEVFDVLAQKGELWLAKNQDDGNNELGWIWEQHFIILSEEA